MVAPSIRAIPTPNTSGFSALTRMVAFFKFASESGPLSSMFVAQQFRFTALTIFLPKSSFHVSAIFFVVRPFVCGMAFGACHSSDCLEHSQRGAQQYKRTHFLCN
jgi:hypothetical protein